MEENVAAGGFGEIVRAAVANNGITNIQIETMTLPDSFVDHGTQTLLRQDVGLTADNIAAVAKKMIGVRSPNFH